MVILARREDDARPQAKNECLTPLIRARRLVKHFEEPGRPMRRFWDAVLTRPRREPWHRVLDGIDLDIYPGETVGVLGRNGAGKSTLLAILAGARAPTLGTVERRGRIVSILELGGNFDEDRTARANVIEFARHHGVPRCEIDAVVATAEEFADIGEYFDQPLRTHSSGMRSRAAFAAALALKGDLVMLDETLAVGDLSFRLKCYDMIRRLQRDGTAFLLVAHNPNTLANLCSRIIVLDRARIAYDGPPAGAISTYKGMRLGLDEGKGHTEAASATIMVDGPARFWVRQGEDVTIRLRLRTSAKLKNPTINLGLMTRHGVSICSTSLGLSEATKLSERGNEFRISCRLHNHLVGGEYTIMGYARDAHEQSAITLGFSSDIAHIVSESNTEREGVIELDVQARVID